MWTSAEEDFAGTERFLIRRRLGAGAYGVVYEAFDREHGNTVALKTLRHGNVDALYRLKREFRALADIAHPNLATLYEMLTDHERWFFTMELVDGANFLRAVRGDPSPQKVRALGSTASETPSEETRTAAPNTVPVPLAPFDADRLRNALAQAVSGISALHAAGKLHRDIKPSNVLVTREGRLVLLDFGLVADQGPPGLDRSLSFAGTPAYMSPEQGSRASVSEASDWYSLGVMLYEALTGEQPFSGSFAEVMWQKQHTPPPSAGELVVGIPEDLNRLCCDLLQSEPKRRPTGSEILRRLRGAPVSVKPAAPAATAPAALAPFVGREPQLEALRHAFESSRRGQAVTAFVEGSSGVGKTALVRRFLDSLPKGDVVVLSGRCYERESVPYKALDSLVDALSQYLKRQPAEQAEALLPRDILALARVFPVLRRVEAVSGTRRKVLEIADSLELRRRAFAALRELLARLAGRRDVVLFIDDLQWGDADSAALLEELMRPPDAPALLLIVSYRGEEAETSPFLKRLVPPEAAAGSQNTLRLAVGELTPSESRELALRLLGNSEPATRSHAEAIARESAGNPFFIHELVQFGQAGEPSDREAIDDMVRARVLLLPEGARRLLEIVAAAGRPLESAIADSAAGLTSDDEGAVALLRAQHLVRIRASPERQEFEPYHDRIREAVLAQLSPEMFRAHHRRLATTLQASERPDPERLALHFREAGDAGRAAEYAAMAAERAAETLAFDRAASLYRMALELGAPGDAQTWRTLRVKMGDALLNAGRGAEAARAYLAAAEGASRAQTMELEGRAAAQLVRSGRLDEALPLYETLTGRVGLTLVQPSWRTLLQYLVERALIRLRGVGFRERDAAQIPAEQLIRLDTYWTLFTGLTLVNTFRGREFQSRHLLLALKAREPYRAALALAFECGYAAVAGGWKKRKRSEKLFRMALTLAQKLNNPYAVGMSHMCMCAAALFLGQWKTCWENGQAAEEIYRERCTGVAWDLDFTHIVSLRGLFYLGGLRELSMRLPALIREARERDDLVAVGTFRIRHSYLTHLASDEPERARENLRQIVEALSQKAFTNPHYWAMIAGGEIALFSRDAKAARNLLVNQWPGFRRSGLIRLQFYRIEALHLRARSDLACAVEGLRMEEREAFLRSADRDVRRIEREAAPWGRPLARLVRAGIAVTRQNLDEASRLLTLAEDELTRLDMALYAAVARRRRGELLGGDEGRALVTGADAWMSGQVIKNPARMADMLAPGSWSR